MSASVHVQSIQALDDLKGALGRFSGEAQEALDAAEQEIRRTLDWLQERLNHWQNEVRRRQEEVSRAQAALARCQASDTDHDGRYHSPNCSAYEHALQQAQRHLREGEEELRNVRRRAQQIQWQVAEYRVHTHRLQELITVYTPKAQAFLEQSSENLAEYVLVEPSLTPSMVAASSTQASLGSPASDQEGSWAEASAILAKMQAGQPITPEDLRRLQEPFCDLRAEILVDDKARTYQLLELERYLEAMRDSREAQDLLDAIAAVLKAINYRRSQK